MKTTTFNQQRAFVFKHFNHKGYSLFAALGKEVLIGVLAVSTLTYAKADGIATKPLVSETDSLSFGNQLLGDVVVTGSRAPLTAQQSAKIVEVISRDDIHRAGAQTVNDVLKLATGVDVRQRGGFGVQTDISINGGTFDQITLLLNGVPLSSPQTGHNAADFPVSMDDIDHIEVIEGAAARVFGSAAFSGAINIVTRGTSLLHSPRGERGQRQHGGSTLGAVSHTDRSAWVRAEGGSFGTFSGSAGGSFTLPLQSKATLGNTLSIGYTQSDGGTDNSDFKKRRGFYQGGYSSKVIDVNWQAGITSQDYGANTFYSARFPNQYEWTRRYIASATSNIRVLSASAEEIRHGGVGLTLTPLLYFHRDIDHYQLTKDSVGARNGENYHRMDVYGGSLNISLKWVAGTTVVGADIRKEHIMSTAYGDALPEEEWKKIHDSNRYYDHRGNRTNTSLFLEHDVILGPVTLSAGLLANKNTGLDQDYRFYPGIDISYRPSSHWKLYASWNKAMRLPTFTDLYTNNSAQRGDINLKPEKNSTFKTGARFYYGGFSLLASAFYSHGTNMIDWVYVTEDAHQYQAMNIGKLNNMGFSIEGKMQLSPTHEGVTPWMLTLGYAYIHQDHSFSAGGVQSVYRSLYALEYLRHKLVTTLSHPIVSRLSAAWSLRWQQRMNGYHPYAKLDGKLTWTESRWEAYVKADNLTAHRYYDIGSVKQPGLWVMAGAVIHL